MFTYGGSAGAAFSLEGGAASTFRDAQVIGFELVLRSYLSIAAVTRSTSSEQSFVRETKFLVENMMKSFAKRLEVGFMYGQDSNGLGTVASVDLVNNKIVIPDSQWAPGIWMGSEGASIAIFSAGFASVRGNATIQSIDIELQTLSVDLVPAGTLATDIIVFKTAVVSGPTFNECAGLHRIITNTGTLFNINAASFNLWKGNVVNVGTNFSGGEARLSMATIENALSACAVKGLSDEEVTVICSHGAWSDILTEQTSKRMFDSSYSSKELENGSQDLVFFGVNRTKVRVISSNFCKQGYAYLVPMKELMRIGSTDMTFEIPSVDGKMQYIRLMENNHGYELRLSSDQALFCTRPGHTAVLQYIKNHV